MLRVAKSSAADLEEYRRMHAASITELRRTGTETADSLARLAGRMEELATIQADDERWVEVMRQLCDEVTAERQRNERRAESAGPSRSEIRLAAVEETLSHVSSQLADLVASTGAGPDPAPVASLDGHDLEALAAAVAEALAERLPGPVAEPGGRASGRGSGTPGRSPSARRADEGAPAPPTPAIRTSSTRTSAGRTSTTRPVASRSRRTTPIRVRGSDHPAT